MVLITFIKDNYQWLLSGIGTSVLFFFIGSKHGYNKAIKQNQKIKNSSSGIQVGGDFYAGSTITKSE